MIAEFLKPYKYIIFDLDGVITSEEMYWRCAALVVCEILSGDLWNRENQTAFLSKKNIFDAERSKLAEDKASEIMETVFCGKKTISKFKRYGVNSNWDLGYYTLLSCVINGARGADTPAKYSVEFFDGVYGFISDIGANDSYSFYDILEKRVNEVMPMHGDFYKRCGVLWNYSYDLFQKWYFGDAKLNRTGFIHKEQPLLPIDKLRNLFSALKKEGKTLLIATGRQETEITPLKEWGVYEYFDNAATYTDCVNAENLLNKTVSLSKPHPYQLLKALFAKTYTDEQLVSGDYDKGIMPQVLVVGDSISDLTAAKNLNNAAFTGVLTGVLSRSDFENQKADFICGSILDFAV